MQRYEVGDIVRFVPMDVAAQNSEEDIMAEILWGREAKVELVSEEYPEEDDLACDVDIYLDFSGSVPIPGPQHWWLYSYEVEAYSTYIGNSNTEVVICSL